MKKLFYILALAGISVSAMAQDADTASEEETEQGWKSGAVFSLSFSQTAMDNWAAGGQSAISGVSFLNSFANYSQGKATWDNTLDLGYGLIKQDDQDWFKSNDKLEFASKFGYEAGGKWYYSALIDFKTQFTKGYANVGDEDYISNFFAPAYANFAIGMDYKPNDNFTVFISPVTSKITIVADTALSNQGAFGVEAGDKMRAEVGGFVKVAYKTEIMKNINYSTKIDLFSNYFNNPQNIDINWDNLITFKINEYINASLMFILVYDDDILFDTNDDGIATSPKLQWKEMFGLGLSYTLK